MVIVAFYVNNFGLRGTDTAVLNYAIHNESILGNNSLIICPPKDKIFIFNQSMYDRYSARFNMITAASVLDVPVICRRKRVAAIYHLASGEDGGPLFYSKKHMWRGIRTIQHNIFGGIDSGADISSMISVDLKNRTRSRFPVVPHMVYMPPPSDKSVRSRLGIPADALVIGRHGGKESFDISFVKDVILETIRRRDDIYFLFVGTIPFATHSKIHFLPMTSSPSDISSFIDACDCMLHARVRGETFGLAVAEFSFFNKPVLTWGESVERAHLEMLGDKAVIYNGRTDLLDMILHIEDIICSKDSWKAYESYSPENVMALFQSTYLAGL